VLTLRAFAGTAAAGDGARIFNVDDGAATVKDVFISGLSVTGGDSTGSGGAIRTAENLTVSSCTISGNSALSGGGIAKAGTTCQLTVSGSTISGNTATSRAGGIETVGGSLSVTNSTISGNSAVSGGTGGGIYSTSTVTTIDSSTISGNQALFAGGVFHTGVGILATITNSTISGNSARGDAGGVAAFYGNVTIRHSTITANRADSDNNATGNGGGVFVSLTQSNVTLDHTIVAGNLRGTGSSRSDIFRTVAARFSLIGDNSGATITNNGGNQIGTGASPINPVLGPLADNGGTTRTHVLLAGSPAIDAGDPVVPSPPANDQRGAPFVRVFDGDLAGGARIDIGAYERQALPGAFFVVDTLNDESDGNFSSGDRSLREAIGLAFGSVGLETITFAGSLTSGGPATIVLTLGELAIRDTLTISGPGSGLLTIDASGNDPTPLLDNGDGSRVFNVDDGSSQIIISVSISGLTLTHGDSAAEGGGIRNAESLTITNAAISDNSSGNEGGGVSNRGSLAISASTVSGNSSDENGGGVYNGYGALTISASTISGNTATGGHVGGGVYTRGGTLDVNASSISGNTSGIGGGIGAFYGAVTVIRDSTISGNLADSTFGGGGIFIGGATFGGVSTMTVVNSTISGNLTHFSGGGIQIFPNANVIVTHSTITLNRADANNDGTGRGGGISNNGTTSVDHTIVAGNLRPISIRDDIVGLAVDAHFSLIGDNVGATITDNGGNQIGTAASPINALLGSLANNGGPTKTHALLAGSPAIDAGNPEAAAGVGTVPQFDQRGSPLTRVSGGRIDIGSFEVQVVGPALPGDYNQNGTVDAADYVLWRNTLTNSVASFSGADGNGDGVVDQDDYGVWRAHFGQTVPAVGAGSTEQGARSLEQGVVSEASTATALAEPVAHVIQPPALPGVIGVGVGVTGTRRENHALRPRLRDVPPASRDDALLAWLARRTLDADLREIGDLERFASDETSGDAPDSFGNVVDVIFERFVVDL
jgi:hypothetical protein